MRDHNPSCEMRIFVGSTKCTCGAAEENYPTETRHDVVETTKPPLTRDEILKMLRDEQSNAAMQDNVGAAQAAQILKRIIAQIENNER